MNRLLTTSIAALACLCATVNASVRETLTFNAVQSNGQQGAATNSTRNGVLAGGYALGRINLSGTLTSLTAATLLIDSRIVVTAPNGRQLIFQPFATGSTYTSQAFNVNLYFPGVANTSGTWTFRFFELLDNGGSATVDAQWNITLSFTDEAAPAPAATDLGAIAEPGTSASSVSLASGQVRWFTFTLEEPVSMESHRFLDIDLPGAVLGSTPGNDTEMALFDDHGTMLVSDDDSGAGFSSQLSFGLGGSPPTLDSDPFDGTNGALEAGLYYLAVAGRELSTGPFWSATSNSSASGSFGLRLRYGFLPPCPADFNQDGGVDGTDVEFFFAMWEAGDPSADVNFDGGIDGTDVETFFAAWEAGGC